MYLPNEKAIIKPSEKNYFGSSVVAVPWHNNITESGGQFLITPPQTYFSYQAEQKVLGRRPYKISQDFFSKRVLLLLELPECPAPYISVKL